LRWLRHATAVAAVARKNHATFGGGGTRQEKRNVQKNMGAIA